MAKLILVAMGICLAAGSASATVRYVDVGSATPTPPYTNWATAAVTIQQAVDAALAGDEVVVKSGVYAVGERETFDSRGYSMGLNRVAVTKPISLRSLNGPQFTVIDGVGEVRCASLSAGASLSGFTLTNGAAGTGYFSGYGGAVHCESQNAFLTNCLVTGSFSTDYGGGVYGGTLYNCTLAANSTPTAGGGACWSTLYNCTLTGNSATSGAGAWDSTLFKCTLSGNSASYWGGGVGGGTLYNCTVTRNTASSYGGGAYAGTLHNCTVTDNSAYNAGGGAYDSTLYNCTLTGNSSTDRSGGASWSVLYNCITYFNTAATEANYDADSDLNYCCTAPLPPGGTGNRSFDPQLASANRLSAASPCRAAGSTAYATGTDIDNEPWGNPPSIGCDEYHAGALTGPLTVSVLPNYTKVAVGYPVALAALIGGRATESVWDFGDGMVVSNRPYASHAWAAPGDYVVLLRAFNESLPDGVSATLTVHVANSIHYVAQHNPTPIPPYASWATAATNIQDAVDATLPGASVLVTNGVYDSYLDVNTPTTVRSVNGPAFTAIQGEATYVYLANGASLSGFTVANGWGLACDATAVASNCVITGNAASQGGGAYGGTLYNCALTGNSAQSGGGAYDCTLYNCTLSGNSALADYWSGGGYGGGAYYCTLYNCTITGNSSDHYAGGVSQSELYNCIVYFNTSAAEANYDADSTLQYSCTTPLPASGTGNIALDPQLASVSHLSAASPCRGAGLTAYASGTDLDNEPWGNPPAIGCDEYHAGAVTGPLTVSLQANHTNMTVAQPVDFTALIQGRATASVWDFGDGVVVSNRPYARHAWGALGDYPVVLRAYNETLPGGVSATITIHVIQPVHYVAALSATPQPPYTSWATAATNIQDAVDAALLPGSSVLVSNGVYAAGQSQALDSNGNWSGPTRVVITNAISLRSLNGPQFTVIHGQGNLRCVWLAAGASLSGFTLTNGWASFRGGGASCTSSNAILTNCVIVGNSTPSSVGGGVYGGTLYNCSLTGNSATPSGGGAYGSALYYCSLSGNSVGGRWFSLGGRTDYVPGTGGGAGGCALYNCTVTSNSSADYGGGASGSTLHNCLLSGNTAVGGMRVQGQERVDVPGTGGGAYSSTLYNCTLTGNSANDNGGGAYGGSLYNCIVYLNAARAGANYDTNSLLKYCCTTPLPTNGTGNITIKGNQEEKILFADYASGNLRLQSNSPCINAGNNSYVIATTDLDGNPRTVSGTVDIGAYEYQGPGSLVSYAWLQQYGLPTDGSADYLDSDHDTMKNWQEYLADTSPVDASDYLRITNFTRSGTYTTLWWASKPTRLYQLERRESLDAASPWETTITNSLPGWNNVGFDNTGPQYFYRIRAVRP